MAHRTPSGRLQGEVDQSLVDLVAVAHLQPPRRDVDSASEALASEGAVVVPGPVHDAHGLVVTAAQLHGTDLRRVFPVRPTHADGAGPLGLHADGAYVVVDVHGQVSLARDPDEDVLMLRCQQPAPQGGDSVVVDGYRLVDALADGLPELHAFLTGVDVSMFGGWLDPPREVPRTPLVRRLVEHTRAGRRVVRSGDHAGPAPREHRAAAHEVQLGRWTDVLTTLFSTAPRFRLEAGEVLAIDNYRCLHGRDGYTGRREVEVLTALSAHSW